MSVEQLKALGFDLVNQISQAQQNLNIIQQELQARASEKKLPEPVDEDPNS